MKGKDTSMIRILKTPRLVGIITIAAVIAVVVIGLNVTTTNAQADGGTGNGSGVFRNAGVQIAKALFGAVEQATGLTQQQLFTELDGTKTLTDIVTEHNADPAAVQAAAKATITTAINAAVTAGKITQAQAEKAIARLDTVLDGLMNRKFNLNRAVNRIERLIHGVEVSELVRQTAMNTQLTQRQIVQALNGGQTLAQIAQAHNADVSVIVSAVTTQLTNRINRLVTKGRLTQNQATKLINALLGSLTATMNETDPLKGLGRGQSDASASNDPATPNATLPTPQPTQAATPSLNAT